LSPFFGAKTPYGVPGRSRPQCSTPASSVRLAGLPSAIAATSCQNCLDESLQPLRTSSILPQCPPKFPSPTEIEHSEAFLPSSKSRTGAKARQGSRPLRGAPSCGLDEAFGHGCKTSSASKECLSVFDLRSVRMLTSPSSIRQRKPLRGPRTTTSSFGTETSSSHNRVWKASSAPTAVILRCLSAPIWQEASQAGRLPPDGLVIN